MSDFNLRGLISLNNFEDNVRLSANCWVGKVFFGIFIGDNTKPYTLTINDHSLNMIHNFLKKTLLENTPSKKRSILISEYDPIGRSFNHTSTITIGRDDKGIIFMEISNNNFPEETKTVKFNFTTPKTVSIDDPEISDFNDMERNKFGAKVFLRLLNDLSIAKIISRDKVEMQVSLDKFKQQRIEQIQSPNGKNIKEDDIPF